MGAHARFLGWIPHEDLPAYWARAEVGILPFHACTHIDTTLANKLFDYMAVGLPVVTSDARPMVRVLRETGAYTQFPGSNPLAQRSCDLTQSSVEDEDDPNPSEVAFYLVTGVSDAVESDLGADGDAATRPNAHPCP